MNKYPNLNLPIEIAPGTSIDNAARDATNLANNLGVNVVFIFNGIRCKAYPGRDPQLIIDANNKIK